MGLVAGALLGQSAPPAHSCAEYFEGLKQKTEEDYAGFRLEIVGAKATAYDQLVRQLSKQAARVPVENCYPTLHAYTAWFNDPHLFVFQSTRVDSNDARRRAAAVRRRRIDESTIREQLRRRGSGLDPIEGIWTDGRLRVAIVPGPGRTFEAIVLTPDSSTWNTGDVRATFRHAGHAYEAELLGKELSQRILEAQVHKGVLLRLSPEMWAREYPLHPRDSGMVSTADPRRPVLLRRDRSIVIGIPSHQPQYKAVLDSLIASHRGELEATPLLIIDLRGNEGGSSGMSNGLLPYVLMADLLPERYPERSAAMMLSSPDQIVYARQAFGSDTTRFVRSLMERLTASANQFVPLEEPNASKPAQLPDSIINGPEKVVVLTDNGTVSAAEVFVLRALRSRRVTVIGEPTAGALDYQSVNIVRLVPPPGRWLLGYPTITRDTLLPRGGMRGRGISPQVRVNWDTIPDPISVVERLSRKHR